MRSKLPIVVAILVTLLTAKPLISHHSFAAEFDANQPITLKGTITKLDLVNPHSWLYIDVKGADGTVVNWAIEMGSPNTLIRRGITRTSVQLGTEVTVQGYRAKDGSSTANGQTILMPDGRRLFAATSGPGAPGGENR